MHEKHVSFKKIKCHNILVYNFLNRLIAYVKTEKLYRSQYQNNNKDLGKKKKKILKGSKKLENWKAMSIKAKSKTIKNISRSLIFKKEHEAVRRISTKIKEYFKYNYTLSN